MKGTFAKTWNRLEALSFASTKKQAKHPHAKHSYAEPKRDQQYGIHSISFICARDGYSLVKVYATRQAFI